MRPYVNHSHFVINVAWGQISLDLDSHFHYGAWTYEALEFNDIRGKITSASPNVGDHHCVLRKVIPLEGKFLGSAMWHTYRTS